MIGRSIILGFVAICALFLAACGTDPGDRTASGALIGAGAGALIGGVAGSAGAGAAIGAVSGAVVGAATDPCDLDLGDPVWKNDRDAYERRCGRPYRDR